MAISRNFGQVMRVDNGVARVVADPKKQFGEGQDFQQLMGRVLDAEERADLAEKRLTFLLENYKFSDLKSPEDIDEWLKKKS